MDMAEEEVKSEQKEQDQPQDTPAPFLPASFFSKLVHQPSCITKGVCDNCGRCEH